MIGGNGDAIVCRCEEVYKSEIERAIAEGAQCLDDVKRLTRSGMGLCQGRICGRLVRGLYAKETGTPLNEVHPTTVRAPVRPVSLKTIGSGVELPEFNDSEDAEDAGVTASRYVKQIFHEAYETEGAVKL
jgi:NAD(P)H-nitrite reductase large subunit